jgi:hypothetical protein
MIFFVLYFLACIAVAKLAWRGRRDEFEDLTEEAKGNTIGGALWAG